jgi:hypothetical protein
MQNHTTAEAYRRSDVCALRIRGNVMEVVYYPNEGHSFDKLEHQVDPPCTLHSSFDRDILGQVRGYSQPVVARCESTWSAPS